MISFEDAVKKVSESTVFNCSGSGFVDYSIGRPGDTVNYIMDYRIIPDPKGLIIEIRLNGQFIKSIFIPHMVLFYFDKSFEQVLLNAVKEFKENEKKV